MKGKFARLTEARLTVGEGINVSEVFRVFIDAITTIATEVVGYRRLRGQKKGNTWWTDNIREAIEWKKKAYKKMLQRNVAEEVRVRRRTEYVLV